MEKKHGTPLYRIWGREKILYGPFALPILANWVRQKRLTAESWVFCDRRDTWARAGTLTELKPLFEKSPGRPGHLASALKGGVNSDVMLRIKVLSGLQEDQLQSFVRYMEILTIDALATAVKEGDRGDALFLILEGEVRVRVMRERKESILATLKAGEFFGEVSLLDEGPRSADVVANERSTLLKISTASFAKLRHEAPALAEPFLHALSQILVGRLRVLNKRYVDSLLMLQTLGAPASLKTGRRSASAAQW